MLDKALLLAHNACTFVFQGNVAFRRLSQGYFQGRGFLRIVQFQVDMALLMCVFLEYAIINLCIKHPSRQIDY